MMPLPGEVDVVMDIRPFERALKRLDADLSRRTRREMAAQARQARDEIRGVWPTGSPRGGHSKAAVTSGTRGLIPVVRLNRGWKPRGSKPEWKSPIGWLVFGGRRPRDRRARVAPPDGYWFYPTIERVRPRVVRETRRILDDSIRRAGLD